MAPRSPHRFYHAGHLDPAAPPTSVELSADESHHLLRVLRLHKGTLIDLFDASGRAWSAEVDGAHGKLARVRLLMPLEEDDEPQHSGPPINLAVAGLKRRAMDLMIEKLSELGVDTLQVLLTRRTVAMRDVAENEDPPARWDRLAIAAAKQCGRNRPLAILPPVLLEEWLERSRPPAQTIFAHLHPEAPLLGRWRAQHAAHDLPIWIVIGPEGGWSGNEVSALELSGCTPVSLGRLTLRAETAAIAAAAVCRLG